MKKILLDFQFTILRLILLAKLEFQDLKYFKYFKDFNLKLRLINFLTLIFNFRKYFKLKKLKENINKAVSNQKVDAIILKVTIKKYMHKALKLDANSKHIPFDHKNRAEVKLIIDKEFGKQMRFLNVKLTDDLKLI